MKPLIDRLKGLNIQEFLYKVVNLNKPFGNEDEDIDMLFHQYQYGRYLKVCMKTKYLNILREIALCAVCFNILLKYNII
jgi:hypothetical protein